LHVIPAVLALLAAMIVSTPYAFGQDRAVSDAEALAIVHKHCVMCHAVKPKHESFQEAPKNVTLETIADLKKYAQAIYVQTVQNKAMPLGNPAGMTGDERDALGRWVKALR
jgi:uncharacterized membrane protein